MEIEVKENSTSSCGRRGNESIETEWRSTVGFEMLDSSAGMIKVVEVGSSFSILEKVS
jgi:hypothetical protein